MHDSAQVSENPANAAFDPTGNVTFTFYTGGNCATGTPAGAGTVALDASGVAHPSNASGALTPGSYAYQATYNGDGNFNGSTSACEPFSVGKSDTSTATTLHKADHTPLADNGSVAAGSTIHDSATVSETNAQFDPTGSVTFTFYTNLSCTGDGAAAGTVPLVGGVAHPSDAQGPLAVGTYGFTASYPGDVNFNGSTSACEPFHVVDARISIAQSGTNKVGDAHTFTVTVSKNDGTGWAAAAGVTVTPSESGDGSITGGTCTTTVTDASGQCTIIVNSAVPGSSTVNASATVSVGGVDIAVATNGYGAFTVSNTKTWVDARISIAQSGTNKVGDPHTFTVTVERTTGPAGRRLPA